MNFSECLNYYLNLLDCSSRELSNVSGISESLISRYRNGKRVPRVNSKQFEVLCTSICKISEDRLENKYDYDEVFNNLSNSISELNDFNYDGFSSQLNILINSLKINVNDMARYIGFDASYISRIRYGKAKPSDPTNLSSKVVNYVISKYNSFDDIRTISSLVHYEGTDISDSNLLFNLLFNFLTASVNEETSDDNYISDFLYNLDDFDLNDYIKAISFDELKVPNIPFFKIRNKNYYGIEGMKRGELDFFKSTVLSKNFDDIFMCSDMPMEDMASDEDFGKKWMFAIALCLKKGLHLNIIHNLDRPFNEMMLGLESWIPIYMTGQISPYYFKDNSKMIYRHLTYVSGVSSLSGECIDGYHDDGKYYLTSNSEEVNYYKKKAALLLKKANSLMDIYRDCDFNDFSRFLEKDVKTIGNRKRFLSSLPLFTIDDELLISILKHNDVSDIDTLKIIDYKKKETENINYILKDNVICDHIYIQNENDFDCYLELDFMLFNKRIKYNFDEYLKHLELTKAKASINKNYNIVFESYKTFKNISISILENKYVILSKSNNPPIEFVIRHPKLISAIEEFKPLVRE